MISCTSNEAGSTSSISLANAEFCKVVIASVANSSEGLSTEAILSSIEESSKTSCSIGLTVTPEASVVTASFSKISTLASCALTASSPSKVSLTIDISKILELFALNSEDTVELDAALLKLDMRLFLRLAVLSASLSADSMETKSSNFAISKFSTSCAS